MPPVSTRAKSVAQRVTDQLRAELSSGALRGDDRVAGEHELMVRFNASRQTVREAVQRLSAEGLVHSRRGAAGGIFVSSPDIKRLEALIGSATTRLGSSKTFTPADITYAIAVIETACCRLAAERCDGSDIAAMRDWRSPRRVRQLISQ